MEVVALTGADVGAVVKSLPHALRSVLVRYAGEMCISGSYITNTIRRDIVPDSDIDVFCRTRSMIPEVATAYIRKNRDYYGSNKYLVLNTANGITLWREKDLPIQFVCPAVWADPADVIAEFDYTITQAAVWYSKDADCWQGVCCKDYYAHIAARRLVVNEERKVWTYKSVRRMLKYVERGYTIADEDVDILMWNVYRPTHKPWPKPDKRNPNEYVWDTIDDSQPEKDVDLRQKQGGYNVDFY